MQHLHLEGFRRFLWSQSAIGVSHRWQLIPLRGRLLKNPHNWREVDDGVGHENKASGKKMA